MVRCMGSPAKFPILVALHLFLVATINDAVGALDISIGIGGGVGGYSSPPEGSPSACSPGVCPSPAPPPDRPLRPSDFLDYKMYVSYTVIQRFKSTITCDPLGVTASWEGPDICTDGEKGYRGFYCATPPYNSSLAVVASIDFNGFGLCAPTIAGFVDQFPDLALFHANSNNFTGPVPDLTRLQFLYELDLSNNRFSGPYPAASLPQNQLIFLDLRYNFFSGALPGQAFYLDLDVLFLNNNDFDQPLPAAFGSTTAAYLTLANNGFTGPIPPSIKNTSGTLVEVLFLNNRLSGCLPYEIGLLQKATVFDAGNNLLTGPIPLSLGCLSSVEQLNLAGNLLYGHVPDAVCQLRNLRNLSLSGNYFTSLGPSCWKLVKSGVLDVRMNCIPPLPAQRLPWQCGAFASAPKFCNWMPSLYHIPCKSCGRNTTAARRGLLAASSAASRDGKGRAADQSPTYRALRRRRNNARQI